MSIAIPFATLRAWAVLRADIAQPFFITFSKENNLLRPNWLRHLDGPGFFALLGVIGCWGAVPVLLRELTGVVDAWTANGIRFPAAAILYWPVLLYFFRKGTLTRNVLRRCLIPASCALVGQIFWALSPYFLPAPAIGFMARLTMVFAILFAMVFIRDERRFLRIPQFYWGVAVSSAGFLLLSFSHGYPSADIRPMGVLCMLICGIFFGMYTVSIRLCLSEVHPALSFGIISQFVSIGVLTPSFFLADWSIVPSLSPKSWTLLLVSSLLGIATAHTLMYISVHRLGPSISAGVQNVTPFVTAILAMAFLGEKLTGIQWAGGVGIVLGAAWLLKSHSVIEGDEEAVPRLSQDLPNETKGPGV